MLLDEEMEKEQCFLVLLVRKFNLTHSRKEVTLNPERGSARTGRTGRPLLLTADVPPHRGTLAGKRPVPRDVPGRDEACRAHSRWACWHWSCSCCPQTPLPPRALSPAQPLVAAALTTCAQQALWPHLDTLAAGRIPGSITQKTKTQAPFRRATCSGVT